jgi:beta-glucosidase
VPANPRLVEHRHEDYPFKNPELSPDERARDLVSRLTLEEKAAQMLHDAPAIPRLGIPPYNWWNEGLHGVARAGIATVFPQAIGLAAMWNTELLHRIATAISDEARAKHHEALRQGDHGMYKGLTYWSPNINIFRDPRWGRGQETYGECPYLTGRMGVAFCRGLQGEHESYLKLVATPKHFAVHSGPENLRHSFNAVASVKDIRETYLPAFHDCIKEGGATSVMAAYNRTNGEPCCASRTLLQQILRREWGFDGYVVSDCWAIADFHDHHRLTDTPEASAAEAVKAGCDLNCGCTYAHLPKAVEQGHLRESDLDTCLERLFRARFRLGMFDPIERVPFASIPYAVNDCDEHRSLALKAAEQSVVMLKNDGTLPLSADIQRIAVIGPNAQDPDILVANYAGEPSRVITPLEGIRNAVSPSTVVEHCTGCQRSGGGSDELAGDISEAVRIAQRADAVVLCLGLSAQIEGEQDDDEYSDRGGDKTDLNLPGLQQQLMERVAELGKPTVLCVIAGSALNLGWAQEHVGAILYTWYGGEEAGTALANVIFGAVNPGGRLPVTFPNSISDVPEFTDYSMLGRTYRFLKKEPLYPFGFGLSYTRFEYSDLSLSQAELAAECNETLLVQVTVRNIGAVDGDEVLQLYVKDLEASCRVPQCELRGFQRTSLRPGETQKVEFRLTCRDLSLITDTGERVVEPGLFRISVGGSQPDARSVQLTGHRPLEAILEVTGNATRLPE